MGLNFNYYRRSKIGVDNNGRVAVLLPLMDSLYGF